jgi:hypothetical protein
LPLRSLRISAASSSFGAVSGPSHPSLLPRVGNGRHAHERCIPLKHHYAHPVSNVGDST